VQNKINIEVFEDVIKKSTLDGAMQLTRMKIKNGRVYSGMTNERKNIITRLNIPNEFVKLAENDEIQFNLGNLMKPLQTFNGFKKYTIHPEDNWIDCEIYDETNNPRIIFKPLMGLEGQTLYQNHTVHMVDESVTEPMVLKSDQKEDVPYITTFPITTDHMRTFEQTKSNGACFGKIYIKVNDGNLTMDTTDQNNMYEDDHLIPLVLQKLNIHDIIICFDYTNFCHLLEIITDERNRENGKELIMGVGYLKAQDAGVIHIFDSEKTEQYFIFSREL
jgi:hypothetical protein